MSAARLAAQAIALLGPDAEPLAILSPHDRRLRRALAARTPVAADHARAVAAVVVLLGMSDPAARHALLRDVERQLPPRAPVVVVDHNQPRTLWRRALNALRLGATGLPPSRAREPTARNLVASGFTFHRLRLSCGERVQLILVRTP